MFDSAATRSEGGTACLSAWPRAERVPRMHWIAERSRVKESLHRIQASVVLANTHTCDRVAYVRTHTRTQRLVRAIKLHSFTVLTFHRTFYCNISKYSTLYTATFPLNFDRVCALEARLICILLTLSVEGHFPKSWNANWSVYSSRRIWLSFLCSFYFFLSPWC